MLKCLKFEQISPAFGDFKFYFLSTFMLSFLSFVRFIECQIFYAQKQK